MGVRENIANRKRAEELLDLLTGESVEVLRILHEKIGTRLGTATVAQVERAMQVSLNDTETEEIEVRPAWCESGVAEADELLTSISDEAQAIQLLYMEGSSSDEAMEFAKSVTSRAASISETIKRTGRATGRQISALENMLGGLEKWVH